VTGRRTDVDGQDSISRPERQRLSSSLAWYARTDKYVVSGSVGDYNWWQHGVETHASRFEI
jgi:hypothetical protein